MYQEEDSVQEHDFFTVTKNPPEVVQHWNDLCTTAMFPFPFTARIICIFQIVASNLMSCVGGITISLLS